MGSTECPSSFNKFLPRDAMHNRDLCRRAVSVCLSVRLMSVTYIRVLCRNK